jgi:hypothetical protein
MVCAETFGTHHILRIIENVLYRQVKPHGKVTGI